MNTREPASVIEDVVLMGSPNHYNGETWTEIRDVVAGKLLNCYSNDFHVPNEENEHDATSLWYYAC